MLIFKKKNTTFTFFLFATNVFRYTDHMLNNIIVDKPSIIKISCIKNQQQSKQKKKKIKKKKSDKT